MTTYKEYKINGGECTFTAHLRLPWIDSVKQHELSSKCCEYIRKTKPEWSHTGVYPRGYNYCGEIPGMVIFNIVIDRTCYNYAFISNRKLGYTYPCPFIKKSRMYGNGVCETNLNAQNCPEGYALVQEFFLKNGAEKINGFPDF